MKNVYIIACGGTIAGRADSASNLTGYTAGLVQAPTYYNPFENYEAAKSRQKIVLDRMADQKLITKAQADKAYAEDLHLQKKGKT